MMLRSIVALLLLSLLFNYQSLKAQCEDDFFFGADFSSLSQVEEAGGVFRYNNQVVDPIQLFSDKGCQIARVRIWHNPDWLNACSQENIYGSLNEVINTLSRARNSGMKLMLDMQYADKQVNLDYQRLPEAWVGISDLNQLKDSVYNYTYSVLTTLNDLGLFPEYVQIGDKINNGFCDETDSTLGFNWFRSGVLLTEASNAARTAGYHTSKDIKIIYHIDGPENVNFWLDQALQNEVTNFDVIGFSYFPQWSSLSIGETGNIIRELKYKFRREVMILETGFPWTNNWADGLDNTLDNGSTQHDFFSVSLQGQKQFLQALSQEVIAKGGNAVLYWQPTWISTNACGDEGQGSPYENASFFNFFQNNEATPAIDFFNHNYNYPVKTTFNVNMENVNIDKGVFISGSFTGTAWQFQPMEYMGNYQFKYSTCLMPGEAHEFAFFNGQFWNPDEKEVIPDACANGFGNNRYFELGTEELYLSYDFGSCGFTYESCDNLPIEWTSQDVGVISNEGNACYDNTSGAFTVGGAGLKMGEDRDDLHFVWQEVNGDVGITAKVSSLTNTNGKAFAGLMIRSSLDWDATYAMALFEPWGATALQSRFQEGGNFSVWTGTQIPDEVKWLHLHRYENKFIAYHSIDGLNWTATDSIYFDMPDTAYIGMAVHSHVFGRTNVSEFKQVNISSEPLILTSNREIIRTDDLARVFPNPAASSFFIESENSEQLAQLFDMQGRMIRQFYLLEPTQEVAIQKLNAGLYLLKISDGYQEQIIKLAKE